MTEFSLPPSAPSYLPSSSWLPSHPPHDTPPPQAKDLPISLYESEMHVINDTPTMLFVTCEFQLQTMQMERITMERVAKVLALPHVTSRHLALPHVTSRYLALPHVTSRYLALPHVTSRHLTLPRVTSRYVTL